MLASRPRRDREKRGSTAGTGGRCAARQVMDGAPPVMLGGLYMFICEKLRQPPWLVARYHVATHSPVITGWWLTYPP